MNVVMPGPHGRDVCSDFMTGLDLLILDGLLTLTTPSTTCVVSNPFYVYYNYDEARGSLHSSLWKRPRPKAVAFSTANNVELQGF